MNSTDQHLEACSVASQTHAATTGSAQSRIRKLVRAADARGGRRADWNVPGATHTGPQPLCLGERGQGFLGRG